MPGEKYLAIETSSARLSLAIGDEKETLSVFEPAERLRHAEGLFEGMQSLLARRRWSPSSLTGVAVSIGPGSFTGIRVGLAAARAFGQSLDIPVVGVNALEILARGIPGKARWISPMIDALQGHVYTALYERQPSGELRRLHPEVRVPLNVWRRELGKKRRPEALWITGDASKVYSQILTRTGRANVRLAPEKFWYAQAATLLDLARPGLAGARSGSYKKVFPLYLRQAAAQERRG